MHRGKLAGGAVGLASGILGEYSFEKVFGLAIGSGGDMTRAQLQLAYIDLALIMK